MGDEGGQTHKKTAGSAGCMGCGHMLLFRRFSIFHDFSDDRINDRRPFHNVFEQFFHD